MKLTIRREPKLIPTYSLTGDIMSYLRCPLQYRYMNGSALPPARPVQMWFGEFIHGILEEAFRHYDGGKKSFPWADEFITEICDAINKRLNVQGKCARNKALEEIARARAKKSINLLGPHLLPLISKAEVRLKGSRKNASDD